MNQEVKNVFTPGSIVSYKSARKISSCPLRVKLYPLERKAGPEKHGKSRCEVCGKQYVRETTNDFRLRWNNYKINDRKNARNEAYMQEHFFEHFKRKGHSGSLEKCFHNTNR